MELRVGESAAGVFDAKVLTQYADRLSRGDESAAYNSVRSEAHIPCYIRTEPLLTARRTKAAADASASATAAAAAVAAYEKLLRSDPLLLISDCDGAQCGWNRKLHPKRRESAVQQIVDCCRTVAAAAAASTEPIRVVSVGSGLGFTELCVALRIAAACGGAASVELHLVDPCYKELLLRYAVLSPSAAAPATVAVATTQPLLASTQLPDSLFEVRSNYFWCSGGRTILLPKPTSAASAAATATATATGAGADAKAAPLAVPAYQNVAFESVPDERRERLNTALMLAINDSLLILTAIAHSFSAASAAGSVAPPPNSAFPPAAASAPSGFAVDSKSASISVSIKPPPLSPIRIFAHATVRAFVAYSKQHKLAFDVITTLDTKRSALADVITPPLFQCLRPKTGRVLLFTSPDHACHIVSTAAELTALLQPASTPKSAPSAASASPSSSVHSFVIE